MAEALPRLKPDPIPAIHPVPEYAASGPLAEVYDRTKWGLGVPWMGVVAMAFAHYPQFYDRLWSAMEPVVASEAFICACRDLRFAAESVASTLHPPPIAQRLEVIGYSEREQAEILNCNEVFSAGNMPYLLMATLARLLLEGSVWTGGEAGASPVDRAPTAPRPALIEPHHADPTIVGVYADICAALGLPFVNTDYRAFARWPSYFAMAWQDLKPAVQRHDYEHVVTRIHEKAISLAIALPNPRNLTPDHLTDAARTDADVEEVLSVVRLFQWLLPGLVTNVAFLRAQLLPPDDAL